MKNLNYVFGPVPSRRLGISLGIDLVPKKICSMNCIYCEVGRTTNLTVERKEYVPVSDVIKEIDAVLSQSPKLDYITFSGSGEPTLNNKIGDVVEHLKLNYSNHKVALLTNSSLLHKDEVRRELDLFDLILPSLDAASQPVFKKINKPHPKIEIEKIVEGLIQLRKEFNNEIWLEIFIVPDLNDTEQELKELKHSIERINPDKVQLNTLTRPCSLEWVKKADNDRLNRVVNLLYPLPVESISNYTSRTLAETADDEINEKILGILERRPCTSKDLSIALGENINVLNKYINRLLEQNSICIKRNENEIFFLSKQATK